MICAENQRAKSRANAVGRWAISGHIKPQNSQLEAKHSHLRPDSATGQTSLTRKRSQVQALYRPPNPQVTGQFRDLGTGLKADLQVVKERLGHASIMTT